MKRTLLLLALTGLMLAPAALAQGNGRDRDRDRAEWSDWSGGELSQVQDQGLVNSFSQGQARDAVKRGDAIPLSQIYEIIENEYGQCPRNARCDRGAELVRRSSGLVYEIEWNTADGRRLELTVDARTGAVLDRTGD